MPQPKVSEPCRKDGGTRPVVLPQLLSAGSRLDSTCWTGPPGQQQQQWRLPAVARVRHTLTRTTLKLALEHAWQPQVGQLS